MRMTPMREKKIYRLKSFNAIPAPALDKNENKKAALEERPYQQ